MSDSPHCPACGASIAANFSFCPQCGAAQRENVSETGAVGDGIPRNFINSVRLCGQYYARFRGRAPRAEYWYFLLFFVLTNLVLHRVIVNVRSNLQINLEFLSFMVNFALIVPGSAVAVRRLHDLSKSGWWCWLALVPAIGWIILLIWFSRPGSRGANRYGPENGEIA